MSEGYQSDGRSCKSSMNICSLPSECLARIFSFLPDEWARREQLPLTCKTFAAACNDIIWRSVRVDARQYREQTYADMSWERVHPWLMRRAGNINGIDLRLSDIRDNRRQSMPPGGVAPLIDALPNLKDLTIYLHKPAERYDNAVPDGEAEFVDEALAGATPASPQGRHPGGGGFHDAFHPDDMMGGPPGNMDEDEDEEPDTDEEDEGAVLPPGHMHAEGGDHNDSDGDGGGSDSEDSGDEVEDGGPAGQAAAGGAAGGGGGGGGGGDNLGPELQAQLAAINLSLQRTLEANTLLHEFLAEWGQQQLVDQMAAATAQINNLSQQLNAHFLQAAADELDEAAGLLQEIRQAQAASITAALARVQHVLQQAGAAAISPSSSPEAQQFAANVDGALPAIIATLHQAAAALDGGDGPEAPAAEQPAAAEAGAAAVVAAVDAADPVGAVPEHAPAQAGDLANAAPQLAAAAAAAVQELAAAAAALGANHVADTDSEAATEAADGAEAAAAAGGGDGAQPHAAQPDAAAAAAQPDANASGAGPHDNAAPDVQHAAEHQPMHAVGHVNAAAGAAGNVADAAAAEEAQHAEPMEGAEAAPAAAADQQQAAEPMDGAEPAAAAAADEQQAAEPMDDADGDAGDAAPEQAQQLAAPPAAAAAVAEVPANPAAVPAVAAPAEPDGQPGADHEAAPAQPQQAPPVAPQPWVPPPPPPPLGLDTLGPADFRAIGACSKLRRLELDMSVRSAALAVAAVQLLGPCSHLEELYVEVTVLARDYSRAVLPFPDALLRLSRLRALSLQIPCSAGSMPDSITRLTNLQRLCLNTPFAPKRGLPPGFGALPLASLTLWGGQLGGDHATDELAGLKDLEMLSLGNCGLRAFPAAIAGLTKLQWVDLGHNYGMGESLAAQPATLLTRLTRLATLQVRRSGHWREEPVCIAAMPLLRGSTGLPLPPEFANLDIAEAEDDMAAAIAAASAAGEAAGGGQDPAAAPAQEPGVDDAEEQLLAAALAASLDDQQQHQQGAAAAGAAADAGDGGHGQAPQQQDDDLAAAAAATAAAHGPGGAAAMADAAGQAESGIPAAAGGGPAAEGGVAPDAACEVVPMEEEGTA